MKIVYLATPEIALEAFHSIIKKHEVVAVVTQTDKPRDRSKVPVISPVGEAAMNEKAASTFTRRCCRNTGVRRQSSRRF